MTDIAYFFYASRNYICARRSLPVFREGRDEVCIPSSEKRTRLLTDPSLSLLMFGRFKLSVRVSVFRFRGMPHTLGPARRAFEQSVEPVLGIGFTRSLIGFIRFD